jgi:UDP-glucose 4-epimerase
MSYISPIRYTLHNMRILVTGSSGTIGTRLCETLLEKGHAIIGVDWKPNKWQPAIEKLTVHLDLRDEARLHESTVKSQLSKVDALVHLAANARVYDLVTQPPLARDNMLTTFNTLEWARINGIKRFIFASSRECYGNIIVENEQSSEAAGLAGPAAGGLHTGKGWSAEGKPLGCPSAIREDMVRLENCESPYTASKIGGEALVHAYRRCYGIDAVIVRFSNVYGMYDDSDRVVPLFIREAQAERPLQVFGKDKCLDFTYIDDAVEGTILALEKFDAAKNEVFNIASGRAVTILELAELIKKLLKSPSPIEIKPSRTGEVTRFAADISKARKILGYEPKVPFEEGVKKAVEWYLTNT